MSTIKYLVDQYKNNKYDFYEMAGKLASDRLESLLEGSGIRAIVTYRTKSPKSLERKLRSREAKFHIKYEKEQDIYNNIFDLAGVRIALYFPGDKAKVNSLIANNFHLMEKAKSFPDSSKPQLPGTRFSGYWANHYRVQLKEELLSNKQKKYASAKIEIQVASVLMHAWSEVEHDLVYKPLSGNLTKEELAILDELNGLVLTGEIALERLQAAGNKRINSSKDKFKSQFDLASFLSTKLHRGGKPEISILQMGNVELLFKLIKQLGLDDTASLSPYLRSIRVSDRPGQGNETISQQIIDRIILGDSEKYHAFRKLLENGTEYDPAKKQATDNFIGQWIMLEGLLDTMTQTENPKAQHTFTLNNLRKLNLSNTQIGKIFELRKVRNNVVHSAEMLDTTKLLSTTKQIKDLSASLAPLMNHGR